jgi:23S rRNA (adenine2030-N6)-methyltransferase
VANQHFGNLGDVWKHIILAEAMAREQPSYYWETHAGSASYPLSHSPARDYGVHYLLEHVRQNSRLAHSAYFEELTQLQRDENSPTYPGSALLAMRLLRGSAEYLLADLDQTSVRSLSDAASRLGLETPARVALGDGLATVRDASRDYEGEPGEVLVHIDPFEPGSETEPGLSAVTLAADLGARGFRLLYWYGYDAPEERAWPWAPLRARSRSQWCGDLVVRSNLGGALPVTMSDISPLIGCGVVATNLQNSTVAALESLGNELVSLYESSVLPHTDTPGALDFRTVTTDPVG